MELVKKYAKKYFMDAMSAMALGLFASLLIGTIFGTVGTYLSEPYVTAPFLNQVGAFFTEMKTYAQGASGMAIGVAIAYSLKADALVMFSCAAVGSLSYSMGASVALADGNVISYTAGPAGSFVAVIVTCEVAKLVSKKTKVDILVTPTVTIVSGYAIAKLVCPAVAYLMYAVGDFINTATEMEPFIMGIIISVIVGMILTLPISSAAICAMIGISGIAGGAATVGCCCQMVGFAAASFRENKWGGLVAQGIGTSMLQMSNIVRKPVIWLPPILASAILGPVSSKFLGMVCGPVGSGMGTSGLVGQIVAFQSMTAAGVSVAVTYTEILIMHVIAPAALTFIFYEMMFRKGWIASGDLKLDI
mgnify:CR=1 FL=1